ncbi:hypothetical protein [Bifidobacterium italicum]|nr:hypothetical protein [Bifidobacterium italicum]
MVSEIAARVRAAFGRIADLAVWWFAVAVLAVASLLGVEDLDR